MTEHRVGDRSSFWHGFGRCGCGGDRGCNCFSML